MSTAATLKPGSQRLQQVVGDLAATLRSFIRQHRITHDEYRAVVHFLTTTAEKGELPLLLDLYLETTVDEVDGAGRHGSTTAIEGPFYLPDAPLMESPCVLPHRAAEPGDVLIFSGKVRSTSGEALGGAMLDMWQSDIRGCYSHFDLAPEQAPFNLRGRVLADRNGAFEVQTWVPGAYEIPKNGPTAALLRALGRHLWRPAHLHLKVTHEGSQSLTTQLFLRNDPWIDSDVVGAVKQPLIVDLVRHEDPSELAARGFTRPYYSLTFDFVLPDTIAKAA